MNMILYIHVSYIHTWIYLYSDNNDSNENVVTGKAILNTIFNKFKQFLLLICSISGK